MLIRMPQWDAGCRSQTCQLTLVHMKYQAKVDRLCKYYAHEGAAALKVRHEVGLLISTSFIVL
jgi:hypothetical protein